MKAILINVHDETVQQVEVDDDNVLKSWYKLLICTMVQVAHYFNEKDSIMVDEEGLFTMNDCPQRSKTCPQGLPPVPRQNIRSSCVRGLNW